MWCHPFKIFFSGKEIGYSFEEQDKKYLCFRNWVLFGPDLFWYPPRSHYITIKIIILFVIVSLFRFPTGYIYHTRRCCCSIFARRQVGFTYPSTRSDKGTNFLDGTGRHGKSNLKHCKIYKMFTIVLYFI